MQNNTNTPATCQYLSERRTGSSAKTGAGDRAGLTFGLCGKPATMGRYCTRHGNLEAKRIERQERLVAQQNATLEAYRAQHHADPESHLSRRSYFVRFCPECRKPQGS